MFNWLGKVVASKANKKRRFKNGRNGKKGINISFQTSHRDFFQETSAEREDSLDEYYVDNIYYQSAADPDSKKAFFIGRTGVGKTAILKQVQKIASPNRNIISIDPEDFAFKIIERSHILNKLTSCKINLDLFYKTMWKYIFITEILKEIYGNKVKGWIEEKILRLKELRNPNAIALRAYEFLLRNDELASGLPFNKRIGKIVERMESSVKAKINLGIVATDINITKEQEKDVHTALEEFEFTDINYFFKYLDSEKDVFKKHSFIILVDDLDKNWIQSDIGINFTRCLFETIFDINNSKHIRLLVSLRTNLFNQLDLRQREKFLRYMEYVSWRKEDLKKIVEKRFNMIGVNNQSDVWGFVFPKEMTLDNQRKMKTFDYFMTRCNMRPRDILFFISYAIEKSIGKNKITQSSILEAEEKYSKGRLEALEDEWQNPYLDIGKLFNFFRRRKNKLEYDEFMGIVESITTDVLEKEEVRKIGKWEWIIEGNYIDKASYDYQNFVKLLYQVGFVGIKEYPDSTTRYVHSELDNGMPDINKESKFYINPCYYRAINVVFH